MLIYPALEAAVYAVRAFWPWLLIGAAVVLATFLRIVRS